MDSDEVLGLMRKRLAKEHNGLTTEIGMIKKRLADIEFLVAANREMHDVLVTYVKEDPSDQRFVTLLGILANQAAGTANLVISTAEYVDAVRNSK